MFFLNFVDKGTVFILSKQNFYMRTLRYVDMESAQGKEATLIFYHVTE